MPIKPIPAFMEPYMVNLGSKSYEAFAELSKQYCEAHTYFCEHTLPKRSKVLSEWEKVSGRSANPVASIGRFSIDEKYKREALNLACNLGYKKPTKEEFAERISDLTIEDSPFSKKIKEEETKRLFNFSQEDLMAQVMHFQYETKNPIADAEKKKRLTDIHATYGTERQKNAVIKTQRKAAYSEWFENSLSITKAVEASKEENIKLPTEQNNNLPYQQSLVSFRLKGIDRD